MFVCWVSSQNALFHFLKLQQEKEDAFRRQYKLEEDLTSKQNLEMELAQLRGKLEVMKHMGAEADTTSKEFDKVSEELKEKDEQLEAIESANQALIIVERRTNDELEQAKKELIQVCITSVAFLNLLLIVIPYISLRPFCG